MMSRESSPHFPVLRFSNATSSRRVFFLSPGGDFPERHPMSHVGICKTSIRCLWADRFVLMARRASLHVPLSFFAIGGRPSSVGAFRGTPERQVAKQIGAEMGLPHVPGVMVVDRLPWSGSLDD